MYRQRVNASALCLNNNNNNNNNNENFIKWIFSLYIQLQISLISGNLQLAT